jgi:predicted NBD/HSP70 family sugar kinase
MKPINTIMAADMRGINRTAILELIRRSGVTSRVGIAKTLGVSLPTVMRIVDDLIREQLVCETEEKEKSGGRRRTMIRLNAGEHLAIGLDLGATKFYGAVTDLGGEILFERTLQFQACKGEESYALTTQLIDELHDMACKTGKRIIGIGVGAPGVTQHEPGIVEWAPSLEWRNYPLRDRLHQRYQLPVIVDNDVNLSALGEMWFGAGRKANNLVLINIGTGIGAAVVIDGNLYRGAHEMAGEIGYLIPGREYLTRNYPGFGALELLAAGTGIAKRGDALMQTLGIDPPAESSAETIFTACRAGEAWAMGLVEETTDYLAIALGAVITFFDPEVVVLRGGVAQSADLILDPILKKLEGRIPFIPPLIASTLGHRSAALGGMINLLHNTSDFYVVRKLS